jgi:GxxExxY protein
MSDQESTPRVEPAAALDRLARAVIGAAIEVHRCLGPGLLESVYEEALCVELALARIPFERQLRTKLRYKRHDIGEARLDLLVDRRLIIELKTVESLAPVHIAQVLSYLRFRRLQLGLLVNFNVADLRSGGIRRIINNS